MDDSFFFSLYVVFACFGERFWPFRLHFVRFLLASWVLVVVFSVELSGTAVTSFVQFPVFVCVFCETLFRREEGEGAQGGRQCGIRHHAYAHTHGLSSFSFFSLL